MRLTILLLLLLLLKLIRLIGIAILLMIGQWKKWHSIFIYKLHLWIAFRTIKKIMMFKKSLLFYTLPFEQYSFLIMMLLLPQKLQLLLFVRTVVGSTRRTCLMRRSNHRRRHFKSLSKYNNTAPRLQLYYSWINWWDENKSISKLKCFQLFEVAIKKGRKSSKKGSDVFLGEQWLKVWNMLLIIIRRTPHQLFKIFFSCWNGDNPKILSLIDYYWLIQL